jgi:hypothetical protein
MSSEGLSKALQACCPAFAASYDEKSIAAPTSCFQDKNCAW